MIRTPSPSIFRPKTTIDRSVLAENRALVEKINRRGVLRGTLSMGALALLGGCKVTDTPTMQTFLRGVSDWNDRVQGLLFRPDHLAPTFGEAQVVKPPRFNAHFDIEDLKPVDGNTWKLELAGLIKDKRPWTAAQLDTLPQQEWIIRHICVEGWDYIGQWSGVNLKTFLERVGADLTAKYVAFKCADDYTESLDMASALHPQTILATRYARQPITDPFGFPLRLRTAVKLGFKNAKWITAIEVTNSFPDTFWRKQGFNWFAGIQRVINPAADETSARLIARRNGAGVAMEGTLSGGTPIRWRYDKVMPTSFHYSAEQRADDGRRWLRYLELFGTRRRA